MDYYYQHDGITIYHGDCEQLLPELPASMTCLMRSSLMG